MESLTFTRLGLLLKKTMDKPNASFFDVREVLVNLTQNDIVALLNDLLNGINENKKLSSIEEEHVYLYRQPGVHLLLRFAGTASPAPTLLASEVDAIIMNLTNTPLVIPAYHCSIDKKDLAQRPSKLQRTDPLVLPPFQPYCLGAFSSILDFYNASQHAPLLIIHSEKQAWSTWAFDRTTLEALHRVSTDLRASRIQLTLLLFKALHVKGIDHLIKSLILSDYAGNVRWAATQYYYELNPKEAKTLVQQLATQDHDPAVQRAAQKTLAHSPTKE